MSAETKIGHLIKILAFALNGNFWQMQAIMFSWYVSASSYTSGNQSWTNPKKLAITLEMSR